MTDQYLEETKRIAKAIKEIQKKADSLISQGKVDRLYVCAALMAVTSQMYLEALGPREASYLFNSVAETFDFLVHLQDYEGLKKVTIH